MAKIGVSHESIKTITINENTTSNARFKKRLKGSFNAIVLNDKMGITP